MAINPVQLKDVSILIRSWFNNVESLTYVISQRQ